MFRNSRTPRISRCTAGIPARPPRRDAQSFVTGILTSRTDFEQTRPWRLSEADDYDGYLRETADLLADALRAFGSVQVRMFHPGDFADFCLLRGFDPAEPAARDAYLVNPPLRTQLLQYRGEELPDLLPRLERARENGLTLCHADLLLDGALCGAPERLTPEIRRAYQQGAEVFRRMLAGAGCGSYRFDLTVHAPDGRLTADAAITQWEDGVVRLHDEDLDLVCALLCAGLVRGLRGTARLHGAQGSAEGCGEYRAVVWEWESDGREWYPAAGAGATRGFGLGAGS